MAKNLFSANLLLENLPSIVYRCKTDAQWTIEYLSTGIQEITGYELNDIDTLGLRFLSLIHPLDRDQVHQTISDAAQAGTPFEISYRLLDREGNWKWVWEQGKPIYGHNNQVIALEGLITDITVLKQTSVELAQSNERLALILESTSEGIYGVGPDHICTFMNRSGAAMLGYLPEELVGQNFHEMVHCRRPNGSFYPADECPIVNATRGVKWCGWKMKCFGARTALIYPYRIPFRQRSLMGVHAAPSSSLAT